MRSNSTAVWEHVKNSTWQETIQVAFVVVNCLVLLVALHVGIVANLFVAWAVYHQKSLQTSNNALLVNLAVIDIFRCAIDCPLLLSVVVSSQDLGLLFCSAQITSFSLICCVQLLTLACISAERYQAIANPFKTTERRKRITVWIPLTWLVPISISVICVIFAKDSPVYVRCRGLRMEALDSYDTFGFYILTPVWCVCLTVIIGFYGQIFLLVRAHERKIFDKGSLPPPDKKKEEKKQKEKETKTIFKNHTENPQIDTEILKTSCRGLNPVSEELPTTTMTDSLDVNNPEISTENKVKFKDEHALEGIVESNDHQNTSEETFRQNTDEDVSDGSNYGNGGVVESDGHQDNGEEQPKNNQDTTSEASSLYTFESNAPQDTITPALGNGERSEEQSKKHLATTSETSSPSTTEQNGTFKSNGHQGGSQSPVNGDKDEEQPKNNQDTTSEASSPSTLESNSPQDTTSEVSPALGNEESSEEQSKKHLDTTLETSSPSTTEQDGTFESNAPQDVTLETNQQDVTVPSETPPGSSEEAAGAPQVEEEEEVAGAVCMMPSLAQRERGNAKKESKLAKRSGYIIFTFLIFWIPLITTVVLNHFYYRNGNLTMEIFRELEILTVSLVCLTSLTNPIIYAAVNPQFRTEFHNLKTKWKAFFTRS